MSRVGAETYISMARFYSGKLSRLDLTLGDWTFSAHALVTLKAEHMPEALKAIDYAGRDLDDVINHPITHGAGLKVEQAAMTDESVFLIVNDNAREQLVPMVIPAMKRSVLNGR